jgi:hypothetical protein
VGAEVLGLHQGEVLGGAPHRKQAPPKPHPQRRPQPPPLPLHVRHTGHHLGPPQS